MKIDIAKEFKFAANLYGNELHRHIDELIKIAEKSRVSANSEGYKEGMKDGRPIVGYNDEQ